MKHLRKLLFPFSILYGAVTALRNLFFDLQWIKSYSYTFPVVCVGNLSTGGTGKSPMIEYLITALQKQYKLGVVSRGYKRKTKGYWEVFPNHTAFEVGDEPLQIKRKFPDTVVAVSERRHIGIDKIRERVDVVLLDDAFQHRKVTPNYTILLTAYGDLYSDDLILPAGNLRESKRGAKRADVVVVTKCPEHISEEEMQEISEKLKVTPDMHCFFTKINYASKIVSEYGTKTIDFFQEKEFTLVTGIANPKPLVDYLEKNNLSFTHRSFSDHHQFTPDEIRALDTNKYILTTEKDFVRLQPFLRKSDLYYLPISVSFIDKEEDFLTLLSDGIKRRMT